MLIYENIHKTTAKYGIIPMKVIGYGCGALAIYNAGFFLYTFKFWHLFKAGLFFLPN